MERSELLSFFCLYTLLYIYAFITSLYIRLYLIISPTSRKRLQRFI